MLQIDKNLSTGSTLVIVNTLRQYCDDCYEYSIETDTIYGYGPCMPDDGELITGAKAAEIKQLITAYLKTN